ncbi:hypothetical protein ACFLTH_11205 [Bacteroidota bacterium]
MKRYFTIITIISLLFLTACSASKYDVTLSEISFDHQGDFDIIRYTAENPTEYNLSCEILISAKEMEDILDNFEIESKNSGNYSIDAVLPYGETKVKLSTRCKPLN